jgi:UDP-N-acetyl-2-amino-2-deoxyglucuronate dehydrogenase
MTPGKIAVGIVGAGWIAPLHLAGFQEAADRAQVVAVCDLEEERARDLAALVGARVYTDYRQLIADPGVDLVDVLLPHHLHHPVGLAVLQARKHLLLEKPLAMTYDQALEVCRAARAAGVHFTVAENTRLVRAYVEADRLIREGRLGQITLVRTFLPANERIRLSSDGFWGEQAGCGGGVLLDCGAHTFYLLKWLFGGIEELRPGPGRSTRWAAMSRTTPTCAAG